MHIRDEFTPEGHARYLSLAIEPSYGDQHTLWFHGEAIEMIAINFNERFLRKFAAGLAEYVEALDD